MTLEAIKQQRQQRRDQDAAEYSQAIVAFGSGVESAGEIVDRLAGVLKLSDVDVEDDVEAVVDAAALSAQIATLVAVEAEIQVRVETLRATQKVTWAAWRANKVSNHEHDAAIGAVRRAAQPLRRLARLRTRAAQVRQKNPRVWMPKSSFEKFDDLLNHPETGGVRPGEQVEVVVKEPVRHVQPQESSGRPPLDTTPQAPFDPLRNVTGSL